MGPMGHSPESRYADSSLLSHDGLTVSLAHAPPSPMVSDVDFTGDMLSPVSPSASFSLFSYHSPAMEPQRRTRSVSSPGSYPLAHLIRNSPLRQHTELPDLEQADGDPEDNQVIYQLSRSASELVPTSSNTPNTHDSRAKLYLGPLRTGGPSLFAGSSTPRSPPTGSFPLLHSVRSSPLAVNTPLATLDGECTGWLGAKSSSSDPEAVSIFSKPQTTSEDGSGLGMVMDEATHCER